MKRTMKCRGIEPGQTGAQLTLLLGGGRGADHRASRPPGFLESCRKCLWGKMSVGGCCPPAGLEVGGLVGLEVWPPSLPALPPGPYTLCSLSSPPRAEPGTRGEYCSGLGPEEGERFVGSAGRRWGQACESERWPDPGGRPGYWDRQRALWLPARPCSRPQTFCEKNFVFFIANVFVVLFTVHLICLELENCSYVIVYTTVSTI